MMKVKVLEVGKIPNNSLIFFNANKIDADELRQTVEGKLPDTSVNVSFVPCYDGQAVIEVFTEQNMNRIGWYRK